MSEQGSRSYPRTFRGLIAAMIVLVVVVVGFWTLQRTWSDAARDVRTPDQAQGVEWRPAVQGMQDAASETGIGFDVVYPRSLPEGWYANTEPRYERGEEPSWQLGFVEGESRYVGVKQSKASAYQLVLQQVDEDPDKEGTVRVDSELGARWTAWSDAGGDHALSREVDGVTVILWGPSEKDVTTFAGLLTSERLAD